VAGCFEQDNVIFRTHKIGGFSYQAEELLLAGPPSNNVLADLNYI
jgi:hypothetical protein